MTELEDQFQQVEQKYGLILPDAYRSMYAAGWMDVKGDNYFWLNDARWMSLERILNHEPEEYHRPGFVPFARTVGGDEWCWWPSTHPGTIVLCPHDCYDGQVYAPSFIGFVYRRLLDFCIYDFNAAEDPEEAEENRKILTDSVTRLFIYLPGVWLETMKTLTTAAAVSWTVNGREVGGGLLTGEQKQAIVQRDLAFPMLDQEFQWMYPLSEEEEKTAAIWQKVISDSGPDVPFAEKLALVEAEKANQKNNA